MKEFERELKETAANAKEVWLVLCGRGGVCVGGRLQAVCTDWFRNGGKESKRDESRNWKMK